jgi:hypothetical protein
VQNVCIAQQQLLCPKYVEYINASCFFKVFPRFAAGPHRFSIPAFAFRFEDSKVTKASQRAVLGEFAIPSAIKDRRHTVSEWGRRAGIRKIHAAGSTMRHILAYFLPYLMPCA